VYFLRDEIERIMSITSRPTFFIIPILLLCLFYLLIDRIETGT
jgi:hypothetical protein